MLSESAIHLLDRLVRLRTLTGDKNAQEQAIRLVDAYMSRILQRKISYTKGYGTQLFYTHSPCVFDVLFVVHLDVVPGPNTLFHLRKKADHLYGRGVFDMKGPAIAVMDAINRFCHHGIRTISVGLLVTFDEETGGEYGVSAFMKKNKITAQVVVVPDGGDDINTIVIEEKGVVELDVSFTGKSAHAARPWEGVNAAMQLLDVIRVIRDHFPHDNGSTWKTIFSLISVRSETVADNATPHKAHARVMFRYIAKDSVEKIVSFIQSIDPSVTVEILKRGHALRTSPTHELIKNYRAIVQKNTKKSCALVTYHSTCDARYFSAAGMPVIIARPQGGGAHGDNEWVSSAQLHTFSDILYDFLELLDKKKKKR